jgi:uncharacterized C2H2 Zn-finger protein
VKEMRRHLRIDHAPNDKYDDTYTFKCTVAGCFMQYKTQGWLRRHVNSCHSISEIVQDPDYLHVDSRVNEETHHVVRTSVRVVSSDIAADTKAGECSTRYSAQTPLISPTEAPWKCPFLGCNKVMNTRRALVSHGARDHNWSFLTGGPKRARASKAFTARGGE